MGHSVTFIPCSNTKLCTVMGSANDYIEFMGSAYLVLGFHQGSRGDLICIKDLVTDQNYNVMLVEFKRYASTALNEMEVVIIRALKKLLVMPFNYLLIFT